MSTSRIHITIKVDDLDDGTASAMGANDEVVSKIRTFIGNMFSDYVTVEIDEIAISDGDDWRVA